jgi:hypothetical protein
MNYDKEEELPDALPPTKTRRWVVLAGVMALAVVAGLGWWLLAPKAGAPVVQNADQKKVLAQVAYLESRLQILTDNLAKLGDNAPAGEAMKVIEEAVTRQDELMRLRPNAQPGDELRLNEWQARLGDIKAREWSRQSLELETASNELFNQKQVPAAVEKLKAALRLQRDVNASSASAALKNNGRETRLEQEAERLEAVPLQAEVARLLVQARAASAAGRWTEALELFGRARDTQQQLNRDYARTRFIDQLAVDRIEAEMATLSATGAHDELEDLIRQATAAAAENRLERADELLLAAAGRQKLINEQFAKSRFVSMERLEDIEVQRQTLHAKAAFDEVRDLDSRAAGHLRRRELFQAQQLLGSALAKLEGAVAQFPKARGVDEALRQRLAYLNLRQDDLVQIQDQTYDLLLPLPGHEQVALLKTEVPQALFTRVMNTNPSRNAGRALPVDSVTYPEAEEFCRRLGWALGATVRLPAPAEFRAAVGDAAATVANAWGAENSSSKSQTAGQKPANAAGFHDLLGNLAEWVAANPGDMAVLAGGSFAESRAQLQAQPLRPAVKTERARTNGFRVVVEIDLAAAK